MNETTTTNITDIDQDEFSRFRLDFIRQFTETAKGNFTYRDSYGTRVTVFRNDDLDDIEEPERWSWCVAFRGYKPLYGRGHFETETEALDDLAYKMFTLEITIPVDCLT